LYVTHDQVEAMSLSHRVAVMRNGRIEQLGLPSEIYESPNSYFVQSFVGRTLTFDGVVRHWNGAVCVELDGAARLLLDARELPPEGARVRIAIRPEDTRMEPHADGQLPNAVCMDLEDLIYGGDHFECILRAGVVQVVVSAPKYARVSRGQKVALQLDPAKVKIWPI
jgi:ABC-type Fe3+/spermidine/putrescine transport system ATPase subunit